MDEHNANEAEDREERRWMEKKNKGARAKRKKEDIQRLRTLVERARANDPRIKAYVKKQKAANEAKKAAKKDKGKYYKVKERASRIWSTVNIVLTQYIYILTSFYTHSIYCFINSTFFVLTSNISFFYSCR